MGEPKDWLGVPTVQRWAENMHRPYVLSIHSLVLRREETNVYIIIQTEQFALTEAAYTLVRVMQEFRDIESRDPKMWSEQLTLTLASCNGTRVALTSA